MKAIHVSTIENEPNDFTHTFKIKDKEFTLYVYPSEPEQKREDGQLLYDWDLDGGSFAHAWAVLNTYEKRTEFGKTHPLYFPK